jgi:hypothetical protein
MIGWPPDVHRGLGPPRQGGRAEARALRHQDALARLTRIDDILSGRDLRAGRGGTGSGAS